VAVAVQELDIVTVCSRAVPEVPQPVQFQEPPVVGCGPNCTELPAVMLTLEVCCQTPPFTRRCGVIAVGAQPPLVDELLEEELELLDELEELVEPVVELELLLDEELELEELEELLLDEELEPPSPVQLGAMKLPSWLPWTPKALEAVWPGAGSCQLQQLVN
jgi:hypothetical protein